MGALIKYDVIDYISVRCWRILHKTFEIVDIQIKLGPFRIMTYTDKTAILFLQKLDGYLHNAATS
jgi:hypothetical protein